mgnify:CR=1 FL=1
MEIYLEFLRRVNRMGIDRCPSEESIECIVTGMLCGLGEPVFDKLDANFVPLNYFPLQIHWLVK